MEIAKKRQILAILMESPFYFSIPLKKRLEFLIFSAQQSVYNRLSDSDEQVINRKSDFEQ